MEKNVVIGYEPRFHAAYAVCARSLGYNVNIHSTPNNFIVRKHDGSTSFTYSRFLVPWMMKYDGWSLFCDCDFLFLDDVGELFDRIDEQYAVMVCKHPNYTPNTKVKMDNKKQTTYPRKNWSSLILWNNKHPKNHILTPHFVNTQSSAELHGFGWLDNKDIGSIPLEWNTLVGYYKFNKPKALHYTDGTPDLPGYTNCDYADIWLKEYAKIC